IEGSDSVVTRDVRSKAKSGAGWVKSGVACPVVQKPVVCTAVEVVPDGVAAGDAIDPDHAKEGIGPGRNRPRGVVGGVASGVQKAMLDAAGVAVVPDDIAS